MNETQSDNGTEREEEGMVTVSVSPNGEATIPKTFRERLGIEAPMKVSFRANSEGNIVLERVPTVDEMRGVVARVIEPGMDRLASAILREERERMRGRNRESK